MTSYPLAFRFAAADNARRRGNLRGARHQSPSASVPRRLGQTLFLHPPELERPVFADPPTGVVRLYRHDGGPQRAHVEQHAGTRTQPRHVLQLHTTTRQFHPLRRSLLLSRLFVHAGRQPRTSYPEPARLRHSGHLSAQIA